MQMPFYEYDNMGWAGAQGGAKRENATPDTEGDSEKAEGKAGPLLNPRFPPLKAPDPCPRLGRALRTTERDLTKGSVNG